MRGEAHSHTEQACVRSVTVLNSTAALGRTREPASREEGHSRPLKGASSASGRGETFPTQRKHLPSLHPVAQFFTKTVLPPSSGKQAPLMVWCMEILYSLELGAPPGRESLAATCVFPAPWSMSISPSITASHRHSQSL